jgi:hypothetical protein
MNLGANFIFFWELFDVRNVERTNRKNRGVVLKEVENKKK